MQCKALRVVNAHFLENLGDHRLVHILGNGLDAVHACVGMQVFHEQRVDLQEIDFQPAQIGK